MSKIVEITVKYAKTIQYKPYHPVTTEIEYRAILDTDENDIEDVRNLTNELKDMAKERVESYLQDEINRNDAEEYF